MLREAGLSPLEVIKAATLNGAKTLYEPKGIKNPPIGTVKPASSPTWSSCRRTRWRTSRRCTRTGTCA